MGEKPAKYAKGQEAKRSIRDLLALLAVIIELPKELRTGSTFMREPFSPGGCPISGTTGNPTFTENPVSH